MQAKAKVQFQVYFTVSAHNHKKFIFVFLYFFIIQSTSLFNVLVQSDYTKGLFLY